MEQRIWWKILPFVLAICLVICLILIAKIFGELGQLWEAYHELVDILFHMTSQGVSI